MRVPSLSDRRVVRTRAVLRDALIKLIFERGWEKISVQAICSSAGIGRSTFYTHFADQEDLLLSGFDDLRGMLRQRAVTVKAEGVFKFAAPLIEHALDNRRLFAALIGHKSAQVVRRRFLELVIELLSEELPGLRIAKANAEIVTHFFAGAFMELLAWSLERPRKLDARAVNASFQKLARSVIAAAKTPLSDWR